MKQSEEERKAKKHAYYLANRHIWVAYQKTDRFKELSRKYTQQIRKDVLTHYGNKCACCSEDTYEFLAIDHINGGGVQHRKQLGWSGNSIAKWLKKNNYPSGFQILCHNCNLAKGFYKVCPHERSRNEEKGL